MQLRALLIALSVLVAVAKMQRWSWGISQATGPCQIQLRHGTGKQVLMFSSCKWRYVLNMLALIMSSFLLKNLFTNKFNSAAMTAQRLGIVLRYTVFHEWGSLVAWPPKTLASERALLFVRGHHSSPESSQPCRLRLLTISGALADSDPLHPCLQHSTERGGVWWRLVASRSHRPAVAQSECLHLLREPFGDRKIEGLNYLTER